QDIHGIVELAFDGGEVFRVRLGNRTALIFDPELLEVSIGARFGVSQEFRDGELIGPSINAFLQRAPFCRDANRLDHLVTAQALFHAILQEYQCPTCCGCLLWLPAQAAALGRKDRSSIKPSTRTRPAASMSG